MAQAETGDTGGPRPSGDVSSKDPVVISIIGYRNAGDMRACLLALGRLTERNFVVSICENGGRNAYRALLETLNDIVIVDGVPTVLDDRVVETCTGRLAPHGQQVHFYLSRTNLGYAGGINVSIRQFARTEKWWAMWILNPDTEPHPAALTALIQRAKEGCSLVASRLVFSTTQLVQSYGGQWRKLMARGLNIGRNAPRDAVPDADGIARKMDYISGASLFVTREFVESVGLLDERYFLYCEEVDWCLRRGHHKMGYAHGALVYHSHGSTLGSNADRKLRSSLSVYLDERNRLLLTRRFFPTRYPFVVFTTLLLTLQYLKAGALRNFFVALSGWWAGLRGEAGLPHWFASSEKK